MLDLNGPTDQPETVRMVAGLAYDGAGYRGFASQEGFRTVAGDFGESFAKITSYQPKIVCAGRTDAGVHALGQVIHFDFPSLYKYKNKYLLLQDKNPDTLTMLESWKRSLGKMLGPECSLFELAVGPQNFDARRSAIYRRYYYDINLSPYQDPRMRTLYWHVARDLDTYAMEVAASQLTGEHNFAAFCRRPSDSDRDLPIIRRVEYARFLQLEICGHTILRFEIQANAFCHQMIRSIVGLLFAIGVGMMNKDSMREKIDLATRDNMPSLAPPQGLCLVEVGYPDELGGPRSLVRTLETWDKQEKP
ncbi:MAG: tRNA pseudouridine(38-40) synthase TruA [Firmicutes bacterium]|nr:tRNA pseudouridine(38-40) synthase TruA [Bacillota bacterium]